MRQETQKLYIRTFKLLFWFLPNSSSQMLQLLKHFNVPQINAASSITALTATVF